MNGRLEGWKVGTVFLGGIAFLSNVPTFQPSAQWRPDERVLITDFSTVTALAASPATVFAATSGGLLIYERASRRWGLPVTVLDGYPEDRIGVALADATDDAVWLGTNAGWARYDTRIRQWQSGPVAGGVTDLALDAQDPASGIYLRTATGGWTFLPRGAVLPFGNRPLPARVTRPLHPRAALDQSPHADALRALMLTDARLRAYQITAAARTPDQADVFLGTNGRGVIQIDGFSARWEPLVYGLPARAATALAPAPDGVWVGAAPQPGEREGLGWLATDLTATRWVEGDGTRGLGFRAALRLLAKPRRLWAVTEQGVARIDPGAERADLIRVDVPTVLAPAPDGVWVGTRRGLMIVTDSGQVVPAGGAGEVVLSLVAAGDTVWIGTAAGLLVLEPGARAPRPTAAVPALATPILALARLGDTLVAATPDQLAWRAPAGAWTLLRVGADVGRVTTLTADRDGVWVGGDRGLAYWRIGTGTFRAARALTELRAGVRDMLVAHPYLWVATDRGVVRLLREAAIER